MPSDSILFQLATHYLPRRALRLECLLATVQKASTETHSIIHHYALNNIFEIIKLIEKPELKSRFLKEFIRIEHILNANKKFSLDDALYAKLFVQTQILNHLPGQFGQTIHQDQFLQSIKQTQATHHADCELFSPQLLLWLEQPPNIRQQQLNQWLTQLKTLQETIAIYLSLLRNFATFETIHTQNGYFQRFLPAALCQLILLKMNKHLGMVPKMQIGHHGFHLRLCEPETMREIKDADTSIELAICQL